jgi:GNAT superfamily N-acetyltransferase
MAPAEPIIRIAVAADIEAMRALERRAAEKFGTAGYDFCATAEVRDVSEHLRVQSAGATFVAIVGDEIAGFAMTEPLDGEAHLIEIDVDPAHQSRGLGRRLIEAVEQWALHDGLAAMTLTTYRDVPWNAPYYARLGFGVFEPGPERSGLRATIAREAAWGFAFAPRVAMRKEIER